LIDRIEGFDFGGIPFYDFSLGDPNFRGQPGGWGGGQTHANPGRGRYPQGGFVR
jgi:hypothetical protein